MLADNLSAPACACALQRPIWAISSPAERGPARRGSAIERLNDRCFLLDFLTAIQRYTHLGKVAFGRVPRIYAKRYGCR
jgi:hypothetical protein